MSASLLIVLAPPRSFSSIIGGILGQHPQTYGFPELNVFVGDSIGQIQRAYQRAGDQARHGLLRTLAQLHDGAQTEATIEAAQAWLDNHGEWTTAQLLDHLTSAVAPRLGVDKSPRTVMKPEYMERARRLLPDARYLHLLRHPRATGLSQIKITSRNEEWGGRLDASKINPDRWWQRAQEYILDFTADLPPDVCMRVRGEDILSDPDRYLPQICEWLGLDRSAAAIDAMKHPERSPYATIGPENAKYGADINFLESPALRPGKIEPSRLDGPLEWAPERELPPALKAIARSYGYR